MGFNIFFFLLVHGLYIETDRICFGFGLWFLCHTQWCSVLDFFSSFPLSWMKEVGGKEREWLEGGEI